MVRIRAPPPSLQHPGHRKRGAHLRSPTQRRSVAPLFCCKDGPLCLNPCALEDGLPVRMPVSKEPLDRANGRMRNSHPYVL